MVLATDQPPQIDDFYAIEGAGGMLILRGHVSDEDPEGLIVRLGGLGGLLDGREAEVDEAGNFRFTIPMPAGTTGTATAQTTDNAGQDSNQIGRASCRERV